MSFSEKAEEIGGKVGTVAAIVVAAPILGGVMMVEETLSRNGQFSITSSLMETTAKVGDAIGRFAVKEGPRMVASAIVGDLVDVTLPWPGQDDGGCE